VTGPTTLQRERADYMSAATAYAEARADMVAARSLDLFDPARIRAIRAENRTEDRLNAAERRLSAAAEDLYAERQVGGGAAQ